MAASAIAGENMVRFHLFAAVTRYTAAAPSPSLYYSHHPYGIFLLEAAFHAVFGHHPATVRIVAVLCSGLSVPLVYALAKELYERPWVAAVTALAFVLVPVDLCFADFSALEVPTIFFSLLFSWATLVHWRTSGRRALGLALVGALGAAQSDWPGAFLVSLVAVASLVRMLSPWKRWPVDAASRRRLVVWAVPATAIAVGTVVLYVMLFARDGRLRDLTLSYRARTGNGIPKSAAAFSARRIVWTSWMLTWPGVAFVGAGFLASLRRVLDRPVELLAIAWTVTATVQYWMFPGGANVHIFWPQYYGVCIALGVGVVLSCLLDVRSGWPERAPACAGRATCASRGSAVPRSCSSRSFLARVAFPLLLQARLTSGRFDEVGHAIENDADASLFAEWATRGLSADAVILHPTSSAMDAHLEYSARRATRAERGPFARRSSTATDRILLLDSRAASREDLLATAAAFDVQAVGPFWRVDLAGHGVLEAKRYRQSEPDFFAWYLVTGPDLLRSISDQADPWATWQWQDHLGLTGAPPAGEPDTLDALCIAHNAAIAAGDSARSQDLRARVLRGMGSASKADFPDDVHLLGVAVSGSPVVVATFLWERGERATISEPAISVRCKVTERPVLWPAAVDFYEKTLARPTGLPPSLWKPRYLYLQQFVLQPRIGHEECAASLGESTPAAALFALP